MRRHWNCDTARTFRRAPGKRVDGHATSHRDVTPRDGARCRPPSPGGRTFNYSHNCRQRLLSMRLLHPSFRLRGRGETHTPSPATPPEPAAPAPATALAAAPRPAPRHPAYHSARGPPSSASGQAARCRRRCRRDRTLPLSCTCLSSTPTSRHHDGRKTLSSRLTQSRPGKS